MTGAHEIAVAVEHVARALRAIDVTLFLFFVAFAIDSMRSK